MTNGLSLRFALDALSAVRAPAAPPLVLRAIISDFHALRFEAAARWALGVEPSLLARGGGGGGGASLEVVAISTYIYIIYIY